MLPLSKFSQQPRAPQEANKQVNATDTNATMNSVVTRNSDIPTNVKSWHFREEYLSNQNAFSKLK